jgi:glycosyltransferase involved in cell wall biosynthesis
MTISIIVPVYAAAEYLEGISERLAQQTYRDYELLFVNDCSPDNSREIVEKLAASEQRVRYFEHAHNRGQGAARNTGLDNAAGEYVMYVDADDSFTPNYLERMVAAIERDKADLAMCNSVWEYPRRREKHNMFLARRRTGYRVLTGKEALRRYFSIYESDIWVPVEPWGKIVRRSFIEKHRIRFKETLFEDVVMTFNEIILAERLAFIGDYLYFYNKTNVRAATVERQKRYIREIYRVPEGVFETMAKYGATKEVRQYATLFYFRYINGAYSFFAKGRRFKDDFRYAVEKYRELLKRPEFGDRKDFVVRQLAGFYYEMKRNGLSELFSLFLAPHRVHLEGMIMESLPQPVHGKRAVADAMKTLFRAAKATLLNPALLLR